MSRTPESAPTPSPEDDRGVSLIHPPAQSAAIRRRRERPAELGRYPLLVLGAVCASSAFALRLDDRTSMVALALLGFGLILVALGATLHMVLVRDRDRWPEEAHAWEEGIEILLHDGELRAALWADPRFALDVFVQERKGGLDDERLLYWRMDRAIPPCDLTKEGFDRLMDVVRSHDLKMAEFRVGRKGRETRAYEIRARTDRLQLDRMVLPPKPVQSPP